MQSCRQILTSGLENLNLALADDDIDNLLSFAELITKWNKVYNLTAIKNPVDSIRLHLLDSLTVNAYLQGTRILDIGTGAGLPGIPLAIANPDKQFVLLDSNAKKTRFVQQVLLELGLTNVSVQHSRIEQYQPESRFSAIITRAFASIENFFQVAQRLLSDNGALLAMQGQSSELKLDTITWPYTVFPLAVPGIDAERCLVKIINKS